MMHVEDRVVGEVRNAIEKSTTDLHQLSEEIWKNPELAFEERHAHGVLTSFFNKNGFRVTENYILDTAFKAEFARGDGGINVGVICEYDALPEIGHACGHNLIAEVGAAAAVGIKSVLESEDGLAGKVTVIGTPGEEARGGKVFMLNGGAFDDVDVVLMAHPGPVDCPDMQYLSTDRLTVTYVGKAAHASAMPWEGVNALDAANLAYNSISCLRQQLKPTWRVSGIITHGGVRPNIIPERAEMSYQIRAPNDLELEILRTKVKGCLEGAALATGCEVTVEPSSVPYAGMKINHPLLDIYKRQGVAEGVTMTSVTINGGSTDMGNVSHKVPGIHPNFYIGTTAAIHTRDFNVAAGTDEAQFYALRQGRILALTGAEIITNTSMLEKITEAFKHDT